MTLRTLEYAEAHRFGVKIGWILFANKDVFELASKIVYQKNNSINLFITSKILENYKPIGFQDNAPISELWKYNLNERWLLLQKSLILRDVETVEALLSTRKP